MKVSSLIKLLEEALAAVGDQDVLLQADDSENDEEIGGVFADGNSPVLICGNLTYEAFAT